MSKREVYTGCLQKRNARFSLLWYSKLFFFTQSFTNFDKPARDIYGGWDSGKTTYWKSEKPLSRLKCHKNDEKIDNDYVLRNDHRNKTTQPISLILVSFFSGDNSFLSDEIKICYIFENQSNENRAFRFWGHPVYITSILWLSKRSSNLKKVILRITRVYGFMTDIFVFIKFQSTIFPTWILFQFAFGLYDSKCCFL